MILKLKYMEKEKVKTYRIGQRFKDCQSHELYLLVCVENDECVLVGLRFGNRYVLPITVKSPGNITEEEFDKVSGGDKFELIENK